MSSDQTDPRQQQLDSIIAGYLKAVEDGREPDREQWLGEHEEFQDDLTSFLLNHDQMQARSSEEASIPPSQAADDETIRPSVPDEATIPRTPAPGDETIVRHFGDYELLEEIARGGMGVVYKARQISLNRIVALKMILAGQLSSEEDVKRFYNEAQAAANLDHLGIVPIYEIRAHKGQHYFSMGYIKGPSLADRLKEGPLTSREAADIVAKVADAVAHAHDNGVVHRDLKPANVLLTASGEPRVTDFGLAKYVESDSDLTRTGTVMGTPSYMSPEQASGKTAHVGPLSDVYSLGAILYCCLTGRPPFVAAHVVETLAQVIDAAPSPPSRTNRQINEALETICMKCLKKDPKARYSSAHALTEDLQRFLDGEPILARPPRPSPIWLALPVIRDIALFFTITVGAQLLIFSDQPKPGEFDNVGDLGDATNNYIDRHGAAMDLVAMCARMMAFVLFGFFAKRNAFRHLSLVALGVWAVLALMTFKLRLYGVEYWLLFPGEAVIYVLVGGGLPLLLAMAVRSRTSSKPPPTNC